MRSTVRTYHISFNPIGTAVEADRPPGENVCTPQRIPREGGRLCRRASVVSTAVAEQGEAAVNTRGPGLAVVNRSERIDF